MLFVPYPYSFGKAELSNVRIFDGADTWKNVSGTYLGSAHINAIMFTIPASAAGGLTLINHSIYGGQFSISIT